MAEKEGKKAGKGYTYSLAISSLYCTPSSTVHYYTKNIKLQCEPKRRIVAHIHLGCFLFIMVFVFYFGRQLAINLKNAHLQVFKGKQSFVASHRI